MATPLMPMATASWLVDNTGLTFQQIADFCGIHVLEVQAIADETSASKVTGVDPVASGQLTQAELDRCQADPAARLILSKGPEQPRRTKGPRYTPVSKRQDKPDAIAWLLRYHPELTDGQLGKLIGTTKHTISAVRDKTHWNIQAIKPVDPVALGLCKQYELDALVAKANKNAAPVIDPAVMESKAHNLAIDLKAEREARLREAELDAAAAEEADMLAQLAKTSPAPVVAPEPSAKSAGDALFKPAAGAKPADADEDDA